MRLGLPQLGVIDARRIGGGGSSSAIRNASKIAAGLAAIKNSGTTRATLVWVGHSVISGQGSNNGTGTAGSDAVTWRTNSAPSKMAATLVADRGGTVSYGAESFGAGHAGLYTLANGATVSASFGTTGVNGLQAFLSASTQTQAFTARGTAVRCYCTGVPGTVARYQVNGGTINNAPAAPTDPTGYSTANWYTFDITGLTAGDTVTLLGAASGSYRVYNVDFDLQTGPGITMHRQSYPGLMLAQVCAGALDGTDTNPNSLWVTDAAEAALRLTQTRSITTKLSPSLVIVTTDINDLKAYTFTGQAWGWVVADIKRHMTNFVQMMASESLPVLIVTGTMRDPATTVSDGTPYTQDDVIAAYRQVSDENSNCAFLDWTQLFSPGSDLATRYAAQQASGYIQDTLHPNATGAVFFGNYTAQQLLAAMA